MSNDSNVIDLDFYRQFKVKVDPAELKAESTKTVDLAAQHKKVTDSIKRIDDLLKSMKGTK